MKKKFALLAGVAALVCASSLALTACNNDTPGDEAKYTGLFTYTRNVDGNVNYNDMVLKDDGSFYLVTFMATNIVGTYTYNADKTKITFDAENDNNYDGTYDVAVSDDNVVTIKKYKTFYYEGTLYDDDYVYNTVRTKPAEPKVAIATFYVETDPGAYLKLYTGKKYELRTTTASTETAIRSSGNYTESKNGDTTTYTLTDTVNDNNATYTFTATYTETDGYSDLKLTGTGIDSEGIAFIAKRIPVAIYKGKDSSGLITGEIEQFADGSYSLTYAIYGIPATVTGDWSEDEELKFNLPDDGEYKDSIKSISVTVNNNGYISETFVTFEVNVVLDQEGNSTDFTVELGGKQLSYSGKATSNKQSTETVTLTHYSGGMFELTFTTYGTNDVTVTGTYAANPETYLNTYTVTAGPVNSGVDTKNCVKSITMTMQGYDPSYTVEIEIPMGDYGTLTYTATLS